MTSPTDPTRRQVLCGLAIALVAPGALVAACGDGGSGGTGGTVGGTGGGAAGGRTTGGGAATGGGAGDSATWALAKVSDVPVGGGVIVNSPDGRGRVLLVQPTAGTIKGFDPTCTHQAFMVDPPRDGVIVCPNHGSQFRATDGSVKVGPANSPLRPINVKVAGDTVLLA